jgi:hypothetical protein
MSLFTVGDVVTKLNGKNPATIEREITWKGGTRETYWYCKYLPPGKGCFEAKESTLKLYEPFEKTMSEIKTLYSFTKADGTTAYGTHIGTNSSNNYLIEEKSTGEIHVLDPKSIEEVLPYTFSAVIQGKETHYVCQPGALNKGDYLLYTSGTNPQIAVVTAIDTKNKSARSKFRGKRMVLEDF